MKIAGFVLLALGVLGLLYGGFRFTTRDRVVDLGPIHASVDREHSVPIVPIAGVVLLAAVAAAVFFSRRSA